jgi:hypothetical protein
MKLQSIRSISVFLVVLLIPLLTSSLITSQKKEKEQEIQEEAIAINIEVPVRVYKGNTFIDNLTIEDFEVYEDGKPQKIEAIYLIKKTNIKREEADMDKEEARKKFAPQVSRNFVLMFEITDYLPKIGDTIDYFFNNVFMAGDTLKIVTPKKSYNFKSIALERFPKEDIANQLKMKLRKDTILANQAYKSILRDYYDILRQPWSGQEDLKRNILLGFCYQLRDFKYLNEKKLIDFANFLINLEGQKHVFLFYQREMIPHPLDVQDLDLFNLRRDISFDIEKIKQAFSDSSILCNFIYITKSQVSAMGMRPTSSWKMLDQSAQIFSVFKETAQATGGITDSSANAASSFKRAVDASENYYLLYYTPKNYIADGKFKEIKVKVKDKKYKVTHRAGYIAD